MSAVDIFSDYDQELLFSREMPPEMARDRFPTYNCLTIMIGTIINSFLFVKKWTFVTLFICNIIHFYTGLPGGTLKDDTLWLGLTDCTHSSRLTSPAVSSSQPIQTMPIVASTLPSFTLPSNPASSTAWLKVDRICLSVGRSKLTKTRYSSVIGVTFMLVKS